MSTPVRSGLVHWVLGTLLLGCGVATAAAQEAWRRIPPEQWTVDDALEVLRDSAWANEEDVLVRYWPQAWRSGALSPMERAHLGVFGVWASYLVRWESAQPVVQAFKRLEELGASASAEYQGPPPRLPEAQYVVTVKAMRLPPSGFDLLERSSEADLLLARLKMRRTTVAPEAVQRTGIGASAAVHFHFPQAPDGAPLLGTGTEEVEFELKLQGFTLRSKFTLKPGWRF